MYYLPIQDYWQKLKETNKWIWRPMYHESVANVNHQGTRARFHTLPFVVHINLEAFN